MKALGFGLVSVLRSSRALLMEQRYSEGARLLFRAAVVDRRRDCWVPSLVAEVIVAMNVGIASRWMARLILDAIL